MRVGLEQQLRTVGLGLSDDREPAVLAERDVVLLYEPERFRVELERLLLVVDKDVRDVDSHVLLPFAALFVGHLSAIARSGAPLNQ